MTDVFRTIIIPAAPVLKARALGASLSPAGAGMYLTGLSAEGAEPATHYISSGYLGADFASLLPLTTFDTDGVASTTPGKPDLLLSIAQARAKEQGITLKATLDDVKAILEASDVSEQEGFVAMTRMGLQLLKGKP